jgi:methionyl-tRNA synthetase
MKDTISFEDFLKIDIRVGTVTQAEAVPKSKKLLKLQVDFGTEIGIRTILAGIANAKVYGEVVDSIWKDSALIGQHILAVVNLAPRQMMGIESHGMLLASHDDVGGVWLSTICPAVPNGNEVS